MIVPRNTFASSANHSGRERARDERRTNPNTILGGSFRVFSIHGLDDVSVDAIACDQWCLLRLSPHCVGNKKWQWREALSEVVV
jgi:hypothetical protein